MDEIFLGSQLQSLRTQRGLSVRKLAASAGITASMLSQIEHERVSPSIQTLRALAQALDVPLYSFFLAPSSSAASPVVTPNTRALIGHKNDPNVSYELLTPDTSGNIEFCMMIVPPHSSSNTQFQSHAGEEVAFFHAGASIELDLDNARYSMRPGDSVRIPAHSQHCWHNITDQPAHILFALSPPSF